MSKGAKTNLKIESLDFTKDHESFEQVFKMYFKNLHRYAFLLLEDNTAAREAVQQVFFKIWERKKKLAVHSSVKAYLYKAVHNECLLQLKRKKNMDGYKRYISNHGQPSTGQSASERTESKELEKHLHSAILELPEQCRTIFQLNRFEGLSYQQVATEMNLSVKTVEHQMVKALKRLRIALAEFLPLIIILLCQL